MRKSHGNGPLLVSGEVTPKIVIGDNGAAHFVVSLRVESVDTDPPFTVFDMTLNAGEAAGVMASWICRLAFELQQEVYNAKETSSEKESPTPTSKSARKRRRR